MYEGHGFSRAVRGWDDEGFSPCFVSGHDFSRAIKVGMMRALAPEVRFFLKGTGFSPYVSD
jgi:hypothetical protein